MTHGSTVRAHFLWGVRLGILERPVNRLAVYVCICAIRNRMNQTHQHLIMKTTKMTRKWTDLVCPTFHDGKMNPGFILKKKTGKPPNRSFRSSRSKQISDEVHQHFSYSSPVAGKELNRLVVFVFIKGRKVEKSSILKRIFIHSRGIMLFMNKELKKPWNRK